jgi:hypothetical protein
MWDTAGTTQRKNVFPPLAISRALPVKDRRLVGPWCLLDRFRPLIFSEGKPMDVAPHPHMGLQTYKGPRLAAQGLVHFAVPIRSSAE